MWYVGVWPKAEAWLKTTVSQEVVCLCVCVCVCVCVYAGFQVVMSMEVLSSLKLTVCPGCWTDPFRESLLGVSHYR